MASPAQRLRAMHLYRHSLKNVISWAVRREIFWEEVRLRCAQQCESSHDSSSGTLHLHLGQASAVDCGAPAAQPDGLHILLQAERIRGLFEKNTHVVRHSPFGHQASLQVNVTAEQADVSSGSGLRRSICSSKVRRHGYRAPYLTYGVCAAPRGAEGASDD